jgi:hypothetical protein
MASGLFKMDTIGDAYVAAAWLHSTDPEEETERYHHVYLLSSRLFIILIIVNIVYVIL